MVLKVSIQEAAEQLDDLITAAIKGDEILIVAANQQIIRLVPQETIKPQRQFDTAKGLIEMSDDFDAPLFQEYK